MKFLKGMFPLILLFGLSSNLFSQDAPTIQACGGTQQFCVDEAFFEACVSIIVDPNYSGNIDYFEISWGDGTTTTVEGSLNPEEQDHEYDFTDFVGTCTYSITDIVIRLDTYLEDGTSINSAFFPTFVNFPIAMIGNAQSFVCVGEEICFDNSSCPTQNLDLVGWSLADGTPLPDDGCFTFDTPGTYTVILEVENPCGTDQTSHTVTVIPPVINNGIIADEQFFDDDIYQICLQDSAIICFNGDSLTLHETVYDWFVLQNSGTEWILPDGIDDPFIPDPKLEFLEPGIYDIVLQVDNDCEQPAYDTITVEVISPDIELEPQEDGCIELTYSPTPFNEDVIYTINGMEESNFPITLGPGEYFIEGNLATMVCSNLTPVRDTFVVLEEGMGQITFPPDDTTTICSLDGPVTLEANPENGIWRIDGVEFDGTLDPSNYGSGTFEITYGNEPCITTDMVTVIIIDAQIEMPNDIELCVDGDPETFAADPPNGTWTAEAGVTITPDGTFDPTSVAPGMYTFYYEVENLDFPSCSGLDSFVVTVTELMVDFEVVNCNGTNLCFELINSSDFDNVSWDFDGTGSSASAAPCHTFPAAQSYDVTVTLERGNCSVTTTQTVTIEDPPVANISLNYDPDLCAPLEVSFTNNSTGSNLVYEWLLDGQPFSDQAVPDNLILDPQAVATSYEITFIVSNDCDTDSQTETFVVRPRPVSIFGTDQNVYCSGDTVLISNTSTGGANTYEWLLNGNTVGQDSVPPVISYITEVVDSIEICLVTTNDCGMDTLCRMVEFGPTDVTAFFNTDPLVICVGDSIQFTNFATPGAPVFYDFGDGNSTSEPNPMYAYDAPGEYLVVQEAASCGYDTFEKLITVVEGPTASWINPAFGCPGDTLSFQNTSQNVMQYAWDFGDSTAISAEASPDHVFSAPGTYEVCLTVYSSSAQGCSNTLCQNVLIYEPPVAGFTFTDSLCLGDIVEITSTATGNNLFCDYNFGDGNFSEMCNTDHLYEADGTYVLTQIVTDDNGCRDTIQDEVFIRSLPIPDFSFELMNACHPDSVIFTNLSVNASSYSWDFGDGMTSTATNPGHYYENPGSYTVTLTAIIDGLCTEEFTQVVTIDETPVASFTSDASAICAGLAVNFTNTSTGTFTTSEWDFGDGVVSFDESPTHTFEAPGSFEVQLIVSNEDFCADTLLVPITVYEPLDLEAEVTDIICFGESTGNIALSVNSGTGPFEFDWSSDQEIDTISDLPAGIYAVTVTDLNGCEWQDNFEIVEPSEILIDWEAEIVSCFGGSDGALEINLSGGVPPYQINWEDGQTTPVITDLEAGDYLLSITDANGCLQEQTIPLAENAPIEFIDSIQHISCFGEQDGVIAFDSIFGGVGPFRVNVRGDNNYEAGGVNITRYDSLAPGIYMIEIEDANGCMIETEQIIIEPDPIAVNINRDTLGISLGESVQINTFYNANEPVFYWSPQNNLDCVDCPEPIANPFRSQLYTLLMTDENNCQATDSVMILVSINREVYIPNTFTPNGDARNDLFRIRSQFPEGISEVLAFRIFDRWGELLFEQKDFPPNDSNYGWDGTFKGEDVEPGVYIYYTEIRYADGEILTFKGEILLVRN